MNESAEVFNLNRVLALEPVDSPGPGGEAHCFRAWNMKKPGGRLFGGQVLSQCVMATSHTVADDRPIHSFHGYFLRAGQDDRELLLGVDELRDGGSFSARRVQAYQDGTPIFSGMASFQLDQPGVYHHDPLPDFIPDPESLPALVDLLPKVDDPWVNRWISRRPFDLRPIDPEIHSGFKGVKTSHTRYWLRAVGAISGDRLHNNAAAAFASDFSLLESVLRKHGMSWRDKGLRVASLDHAMWFHEPIDFNEWILFDYRSPAAGGGRGLGQGNLFTQDGRLVATVAQQGMVRVPELR